MGWHFIHYYLQKQKYINFFVLVFGYFFLSFLCNLSVTFLFCSTCKIVAYVQWLHGRKFYLLLLVVTPVPLSLRYDVHPCQLEARLVQYFRIIEKTPRKAGEKKGRKNPEEKKSSCFFCLDLENYEFQNTYA